MNSQLLKAQMVRVKDTLAELSAVLGCTPGTLSLKINGKSEFTQNEIALISRHYQLSAEEIKEMFFND